MVYIELILTSYQNKIFKKELIFLPALSLFFLYVIWPLLWENPIQSLLHVIYWFKELPNNEITNYYLGSDHNSMNTPWHYLIIWILNTSPFFYLVLIILGIIIFAQKKNEYPKIYKLIFFTTLIPFVLVIFFDISLYDGWRHFYFIAPFLTIFCLISVDYLIKLKIHKYIKYFFVIILVSSFIKNIWDLKKLHPYQNLYFNYLFTSKPYELFDKDYWGLTNRAVLENFYKINKSKKIIYADASTIITKTSNFINKFDQREFIHYKKVNNKEEGPLYFFVLNRYHPPYDIIKKKSETIYEYKIDNVVINGVYEFKNINDFLNLRN